MTSTDMDLPTTVIGLSMRQVLARASQELTANAVLLHDCQAAIGAILPAQVPEEVGLGLQGLDTVTQTIAELADLLDRLSLALATDQILAHDALSHVRLTALHERLAGLSPPCLVDAAARRQIELW